MNSHAWISKHMSDGRAFTNFASSKNPPIKTATTTNAQIKPAYDQAHTYASF